MLLDYHRMHHKTNKRGAIACSVQQVIDIEMSIRVVACQTGILPQYLQRLFHHSSFFVVGFLKISLYPVIRAK